MTQSMQLEPDKIIGRALIVDDDEQTSVFYRHLFQRQGLVVDLAEDLETLKSRLRTNTYEVVLLDLELGKEDGLDGLEIILREAPYTRIYILTAHGSVHRAVEAMRRGASGFFEKGSDPRIMIDELLSAAQASTAPATDLAQVGLVGRSEALSNIMGKIERLRDVDSSVLLLGESGTGKEVIARAIHRTSKRSKFRFSAINCGAIPESLLESELFGHKRGSFTDAKADRKGIFELCSQGTLLLDEIGDMPLSLQTKLLRVLQEREITPVGSAETVKIDTRIIAATHRDIMSEANAKRFREDLYYRLSIVVLRIPPLRQRVEDIPLLVNYFLETYNQRFGREIRPPSPSTMSRLMAYKWPGNIRELKNAIERAVVLSSDGQIGLEDVFASLSFSSAVEQISPQQDDQEDSETALFHLKLTDAKQAFERRYLEYQLKTCHGNVIDVASKSGRYRADVYRLLNRYGLDHCEFRN